MSVERFSRRIVSVWLGWSRWSSVVAGHHPAAVSCVLAPEGLESASATPPAGSLCTPGGNGRKLCLDVLFWRGSESRPRGY